MPSENVHDDLPAYQQSALARLLTMTLMARAGARREAYEGARRRRTVTVRAGQPRTDARAKTHRETTATSRNGDAARRSGQPAALPRESIRTESRLGDWLQPRPIRERRLRPDTRN